MIDDSVYLCACWLVCTRTLQTNPKSTVELICFNFKTGSPSWTSCWAVAVGTEWTCSRHSINMYLSVCLSVWPYINANMSSKTKQSSQMHRTDHDFQYAVVISLCTCMGIGCGFISWLDSSVQSTPDTVLVIVLWWTCSDDGVCVLWWTDVLDRSVLCWPGLSSLSGQGIAVYRECLYCTTWSSPQPHSRPLGSSLTSPNAFSTRPHLVPL